MPQCGIPTEHTIRFDTPDGPLQVTLRAGDDVEHVSHVAGIAHQLTDALMQASTQAVTRRGFPVTCAKGCSMCCRHLVAVTPLEAFLLYDAVRALPQDQQERIDERTRQVDQTLDSVGMHERIDTIEAGEAGRTVVQDYFRLQLDCPLLEDGACSVYASRPAACRQLLVVSDPSECARPTSGGVRGAPVLLNLTHALERISDSLFPDHPRRIPLVRARQWVEDNEDLWEVGARGVNLLNALLQALGK